MVGHHFLHLVFERELDPLYARFFGEFHFIQMRFGFELMKQLLIFGMLDRETPELGVAAHELELYFFVMQLGHWMIPPKVGIDRSGVVAASHHIVNTK